MTAPKEPAIVRPVLLERHVTEDPGNPAPDGRVHLFARCIWASTLRVEFNAWVGAIPGSGFERVPKGLRSRSSTLKTCRHPLLAQEWAWGLWDEYRADVIRELSP